MAISRINVSFFIISFISHVVYIIAFQGAQDILAGSNLPTAAVIIADVLPYLLGTLLNPCIAHSTSYLLRFMVIGSFLFSAFMILGLASDISWKIFGVVLSEFSIGMADSSTVALSSYFDSSALSMFSTGSGVGFLVSPLYYTGMTTWLCVSPQTTFLTIGPLSVLFPLCYCCALRNATETSRNKQELTYSKLKTSEDEDTSPLLAAAQPQASSPSSPPPEPSMPPVQSSSSSTTSFDDAENIHSTENSTLSIRQRLAVLGKVVYLCGVPNFIAYLVEVVLNQSVVTSIAYPNSPFKPRDHYQYYSLAVMIGEVLGRSHRSIINTINPKMLYNPTMTQLWVLCGLTIFQLLFLLCESWYRFLPNVVMVIFLCFSTGFENGVIFANSFELVRSSFVGKASEFALSFTLFPFDVGACIASLLGFYVEPKLVKRCQETALDVDYCLTRSSNLEAIALACRGQL